MRADRIPAQIKRLRIISPELIDSLLAGNYRSVFKGPGIEFDEVREYIEGDDARLIDWNVSSRLGSPFTKTFREERELTVFALVDVSPSIAWGRGVNSRREVAAVVFSLLALAAVGNNDRVGRLLFTDRVESYVAPMKGKKHAMRQMADLFDFKPEGTGSDLAMAIRTAGEALTRRGICVIISDFKTSGYFRDLSLLRRKHDVVAVRIVDRSDAEFPATGLVQLVDPETGAIVSASGRSRRYRRAYAERAELIERRWRRECSRRRIQTLDIATDDDPAARLISFFRRRRR